jgi:hypothetical protein
VVVREFLRRHFRINNLPCYSWFTRMLRMIDPKWLNEQFSGDKNIQLNSNIIRKHVINSIKTRLDILGVKRPISRLLFDNLLAPTSIIPFLNLK